MTKDLKKFDIPIGTSALISARLVMNATLKIHAGTAHGLAHTQLNTDLPVFLNS